MREVGKVRRGEECGELLLVEREVEMGEVVQECGAMAGIQDAGPMGPLALCQRVCILSKRVSWKGQADGQMNGAAHRASSAPTLHASIPRLTQARSTSGMSACSAARCEFVAIQRVHTAPAARGEEHTSSLKAFSSRIVRIET